MHHIPRTCVSDPDSDGPKDGSGDGMEKEDQKNAIKKEEEKPIFPLLFSTCSKSCLSFNFSIGTKNLNQKQRI